MFSRSENTFNVAAGVLVCYAMLTLYSKSNEELLMYTTSLFKTVDNTSNRKLTHEHMKHLKRPRLRKSFKRCCQSDVRGE